MTCEEMDLGPDVTRDEAIAADVELRERAAAWAEVQRGDVWSIQRRLIGSLHDFTPVPVGTGRLRTREEA